MSADEFRPMSEFVCLSASAPYICTTDQPLPHLWFLKRHVNSHGRSLHGPTTSRFVYLVFSPLQSPSPNIGHLQLSHSPIILSRPLTLSNPSTTSTIFHHRYGRLLRNPLPLPNKMGPRPKTFLGRHRTPLRVRSRQRLPQRRRVLWRH